MDELELLKLAKNGNIDSRNAIIEKYDKCIYFVMKRMLSYSIYKDNKEDLYQEGVLTLIDCIQTFDESKGNFKNWFIVNYRYKISDWIKYNLNNSSFNMITADMEKDTVVEMDTDNSLCYRLTENINKPILHKELSKLIPIITDRELALFRYKLGLVDGEVKSMKDCCKYLGWSKQTAISIEQGFLKKIQKLDLNYILEEMWKN